MKPIKWIIGYIDCFRSIQTHVVREGDTIDSHTQRWPDKLAAHGKFRWSPKNPCKLATYNEDVSDEEFVNIIDKILSIEKREKIRETR
jgi:hypothetical protein